MATTSNVKLKAPNAVLNYGFDWSDWLVDDTITASTWTVPSGITNDADTFTDTTATIWLSGGTAGHNYKLVNTITTNAGRTDERSLVIQVSNR